MGVAGGKPRRAGARGEEIGRGSDRVLSSGSSHVKFDRHVKVEPKISRGRPIATPAYADGLLFVGGG